MRSNLPFQPVITWHVLYYIEFLELPLNESEVLKNGYYLNSELLYWNL